MASLQLLWDFLLLCRSNGLVSFNFPEEEMHRKVCVCVCVCVCARSHACNVFTGGRVLD